MSKLTTGLTNALGEETSPYLRQHMDNPVHWQGWSPEALEMAAQHDKPILLSIGYAACHWCHVMAHESFENQTIAEVMNRDFINIKVDREERPDIDHIYMQALHMMGEQGGWPLTMFLLPDGKPFWGGTYFPPEPRYGRPGFLQILDSISRAYREKRGELQNSASQINTALDQMAKTSPQPRLTIRDINKLSASFLQHIDPVYGGTLGAPKFPQTPAFRFLWRAGLRSGDDSLQQAIILTMDKICDGGIYDHLGGGFARYATDEVWLAPHFEKMLYDNAALIELLTEIWTTTGNDLYARRVEETIDWLIRDMRSEETGAYAFVSSFDADSEGIEGKFYVWDKAEVDSVLERDSQVFCQIYNVEPGGNWEGHSILNRPAGEGEVNEYLMKSCRNKLFEVRNKRIPPGRDDKVLADWNGMTISALVQAGTAFNKPEWIDLAKSVFTYICDKMIVGGRLVHSYCEGQARHTAVLDDYAWMARAGLILYEACGEQSLLDLVITWTRSLEKHYWDGAGGGYYLTADDSRDLISRSKTIGDNVYPSGNAVMVEVLTRLSILTGNIDYLKQADRIIDHFSPERVERAIDRFAFLDGQIFQETVCQVVCVGKLDSGEGTKMKALLDRSDPSNRILIFVSDPTTLPESHPVHSKQAIDGKFTVYLCRGQVCGMPIINLEMLQQQLTEG